MAESMTFPPQISTGRVPLTDPDQWLRKISRLDNMAGRFAAITFVSPYWGRSVATVDEKVKLGAHQRRLGVTPEISADRPASQVDHSASRHLVPLAVYFVSARQQHLYRASAEVLLTSQSLASTLSGVPGRAQVSPIGTPKRRRASPSSRDRTARVCRCRAFPFPAGIFSRIRSLRQVNLDLLTFWAIDQNPDLAVRLATEYARQFRDYRLERTRPALRTRGGKSRGASPRSSRRTSSARGFTRVSSPRSSNSRPSRRSRPRTLWSSRRPITRRPSSLVQDGTPPSHLLSACSSE